METWSDILDSSQLLAGQVAELQWQDQDLLLYRLTNGNCRVTTAWCPHMRNYIPNGLAPGTPISALLRDDKLVCPYHGWHFDGLGRCTLLPSGQRVPRKIAAGEIVMRAWSVRERDGKIQLGPELTESPFIAPSS
jgi:phenylpropionate dioxygenase-like ring-hydroxylating dioxygenase large terminal subunit